MNAVEAPSWRIEHISSIDSAAKSVELVSDLAKEFGEQSKAIKAVEGKIREQEIRPSHRELTPKQAEMAQIFANILPGRQRPDLKLIGAMRSKQSIATNSSPSLTSSLPSTVPLDSPATIPVSVAPQPGRTNDWEQDALRGIRKNRLSLYNAWSHKTWKNKSNNFERLKLLKDDGYDISHLQAKNTSADKIIQAIFNHVKERKQQAVAPDTLQVTLQHNGGVGQPFSSTGTATVAAQDIDRLSPALDGQPEGTLMDNGQLIPKLLWVPSLSPPRKRKHDHEDERKDGQVPTHLDCKCPWVKIKPDPLPCTCGPKPKRLRLSRPRDRQREMNSEALLLLRKNIARDLFRSFRAGHEVFEATLPPDNSRVIFSPIEQLKISNHPADVIIGSRGLAHIMDEILYLSDKGAKNGILYIRDPDAVYEQESDETNDRSMHRQVCVFNDSHGCTIMEGNAIVLARLMARLGNHNLVHRSKWNFDGMELVCSGQSWSLSDYTQNSLAKIEEILRANADGNEVKVRIKQDYNGRKLQYD